MKNPNLTKSKIPNFDLSLIQLTFLPKHLWIGKGIFHPEYQVEDTPYWIKDQDGQTLQYNIGIIYKVTKDKKMNCNRVWFHTKNGSFNYPDWNIWIPLTKDIEEHIIIYQKQHHGKSISIYRYIYSLR